MDAIGERVGAASPVRSGAVVVGTELGPQRYEVDRASLVRYAGASGDFNPIHWDQQTAQAVGLPDVIAHGMLTMALACRLVTDWLDDPGAVQRYGVRFTRPVPVSAHVLTAIDVLGVVSAVTPAGHAQIDLRVTVDGRTVLAKAQVLARLTPSHGERDD